MKTKNAMTQTLWDATKTVLRGEIYDNTTLPLETRKISNKQTYLKPKATEERTNKT